MFWWGQRDQSIDLSYPYICSIDLQPVVEAVLYPAPPTQTVPSSSQKEALTAHLSKGIRRCYN